MKRHVVSLLSCGLLAGCATAPPPIDEPSALPTTPNTSEQPSPAAFHFKSGTLEIGDFDPYTLGDDIFDPCTEISPEEFAAAGFDNVEPIPEEYAGLARGLSVCNFTAHSGLAAEGFAQNNATRAEVERQGPLFSDYSSSLLPQLYVYGPRSGIGAHCFAQLDTARGGLVSIASGWDASKPNKSICTVAIQNLEALYKANAE